MPTGRKHTATYREERDGEEYEVMEPCRCTIGVDHRGIDVIVAIEDEDEDPFEHQHDD